MGIAGCNSIGYIVMYYCGYGLENIETFMGNEYNADIYDDNNPIAHSDPNTAGDPNS